MAMARDPNFEYNLDQLTRLMEEQALGSPQGARPKKKSKKSTSAKTSEVVPPSAKSSELELEQTRQENLKLQLEMVKAQVELAKLTGTKAETGGAQQQISPDNLHASLISHSRTFLQPPHH